MSAAASPSEGSADHALAAVRMRGGYKIGVGRTERVARCPTPAPVPRRTSACGLSPTYAFADADVSPTRLTDLDERGGWRVRFPDVEGNHVEAVTINTGGGILGGDRISATVAVASGDLVVTSQAAERIYRSLGPSAHIDASLSLGAGARLDWLPQETILFSGARLARHFDVEMAADASLTMAEMIVLGRKASGEVVAAGALSDTWRIRRGSRLAYADNVRLAGAIDRHLARPAVGGGANTTAVIVHVTPDAEERLPEVRAALAHADCDCGASAWNGMLVARFLGPHAAAVRTSMARTLETLARRALPRVWQL